MIAPAASVAIATHRHLRIAIYARFGLPILGTPIGAGGSVNRQIFVDERRETYEALMSDDLEAFARIRVGSQAITRAGRNVLNAEWARVKRGD